MKTKWWIIALVVIVAIIALVRSVVFVDETEVVIITQFGRPVRTVEEAGLIFKAPYQSALRFDRRLQMYDPLPSEFLTSEKKNLDLDVFVCWRISNPQQFLQSVTDSTGARLRIHDIVFAELAAAFGQAKLDYILTTDAESRQLDQMIYGTTAMCRVFFPELAAAFGQAELNDILKRDVESRRLDPLIEGVTANCRDRLLASSGIEVLDVRLKRISLPGDTDVRESVFDRMRSERERLARQYRAEGDEAATKIRAEADKDKTVMLADAYAAAEKIRGKGEADAIRIYTQAHEADPEFYELTRTLEAYEKFLDEKTTILLSSDSDLLKYLTRGAMPPQGSMPAGTVADGESSE
jgi:membrane protease subunit HflC